MRGSRRGFTGKISFGKRREKKRRFFSPRELLGEKTFLLPTQHLPAWGEGQLVASFLLLSAVAARVVVAALSKQLSLSVSASPRLYCS
ncbi:hypothetical protein BHE74_00017330 [Ensete ventricosum]|nr:hypothetical protein GW17_00014321 [Ensete ventricosum]RWW74718.1 hypothetical protein BHE74_00017330 [Ensete ventricosum]RZR95439.1 hypothetical protein BHM03_00024296 [Ensete ventricosum]